MESGFGLVSNPALGGSCDAAPVPRDQWATAWDLLNIDLSGAGAEDSALLLAAGCRMRGDWSALLPLQAVLKTLMVRNGGQNYATPSEDYNKKWSASESPQPDGLGHCSSSAATS